MKFFGGGRGQRKKVNGFLKKGIGIGKEESFSKTKDKEGARLPCMRDWGRAWGGYLKLKGEITRKEFVNSEKKDARRLKKKMGQNCVVLIMRKTKRW